jgi:hypothetical protein
MPVTAAPDFADLQANRPKLAGVALRCDACAAPVFLRYRLKSFGPERIEFHPGAAEVERPPESFHLHYLPEPVANLFRDALGCYTHGLHTAFVLLCSATARAVFEDLGEPGKLKIFDQVEEVQQMAAIDDDKFSKLRRIIFDADRADTAVAGPLSEVDTAVLLETMKDMLYQSYVRAGKLQSALRMRQYFADPASAEQDESMIVRAVRRAGASRK